MTDAALIEKIRASSRLMVRELGFMRSTLAATDYSPSAVHTLLEIASSGSLTAAQLVQVLGLEKSSVSRMLSRLIASGELQEVVSEADARVKQLQLTEQGKATVARINTYGNRQVINAIAHLPSSQQQAIEEGLSCYAQALHACRDNACVHDADQIQISTGYQPGLIGRVAEMHADFYAHHYGFGHFFEGKVASELAAFSGRLEEACNQIWVATHRGRIVGSIAIDGQDLGNNNAHLRWFILDGSCRGRGVGRMLLQQALAFCDRYGFSSVQLWTFSGLDSARHLYESFGFRLEKAWQGDQWGSSMLEQKFIRTGRAD